MAGDAEREKHPHKKQLTDRNKTRELLIFSRQSMNTDTLKYQVLVQEVQGLEAFVQGWV